MADAIEIGAEVRERELRLTSITMMPSGSRNHLRIRITFDAEWEGTTKTLVAYRDLSKPYHVPLGLDGMALIPHEVLAEQGVVYLGVFGVAGDQRVTSTIVRYGVNEGALTEGLQPSDPTPEMWDQLISSVNEVRQAAESAMRDAQTAAQSAQQSEQAAAGSATQADGAATRAETAADTATTLARDAEMAKTDAQNSAQSAGERANAAATSAQQAQESQTAAAESATSAQASAAEATKQASASEASAVRAEKSADDAKTAAERVETMIDDTSIVRDRTWSSRNIVDMLCPPIDETGNPVVCNPVAGYPLSITASWGPTQEGAGDPSPENIRPITGRENVTVKRSSLNILDASNPHNEIVGGASITWDNGVFSVDGTITSGNLWIQKGLVLPAGEYTAQLYGGDFIDGTTSLLWAYGDGVQSIVTAKTKKIKITVTKPELINVCWHINSALTASGQFSVTIAPGGEREFASYTPYIGQTNTITLPKTVYGGEVNVVTGDSVETWKVLDLAEADISLYGINQYGISNFSLFSKRNNIQTTEGKEDFFTSSLPKDTTVYTETKKIGIMKANASTFYIRIKESDARDVKQAKAYLQSIHAKIVYKLATPLPITASGDTEIPALNGINTILTDADSVTVTGRADPTAYYGKKIAEISAAIVAR